MRAAGATRSMTGPRVLRATDCVTTLEPARMMRGTLPLRAPWRRHRPRVREARIAKQFLVRQRLEKRQQVAPLLRQEPEAPHRVALVRVVVPDAPVRPI